MKHNTTEVVTWSSGVFHGSVDVLFVGVGVVAVW